MKKEDIDFLKELQNELNTQTDDGNANPIFWGIMERKEVPVPEGEGDILYYYIGDDYETKYTFDEFINVIDEEVKSRDDEDITNEWNEIKELDLMSNWELDWFVKETLGWDFDVYEFAEKDVISEETGAFLTKRAAREYIEKYGYNHTKPRTYVMTAYRNYEYGKLLNILKTMNFNDIKVD